MQDFQGGRAWVGFWAFEVAGSWFLTWVGGTWHPGGWSAFKWVSKLDGGAYLHCPSSVPRRRPRSGLPHPFPPLLGIGDWSHLPCFRGGAPQPW
jgi:hypothetical protein